MKKYIASVLTVLLVATSGVSQNTAEETLASMYTNPALRKAAEPYGPRIDGLADGSLV